MLLQSPKPSHDVSNKASPAVDFQLKTFSGNSLPRPGLMRHKSVSCLPGNSPMSSSILARALDMHRVTSSTTNFNFEKIEKRDDIDLFLPRSASISVSVDSDVIVLPPPPKQPVPPMFNVFWFL